MFPTDWMPCPDVHAFKSKRKAKKFAIKKYGVDPDTVDGADGLTLTFRSDETKHVVCLVVVDTDDSSAENKIALLAHECVHVAQTWADCMGEKNPGIEWMAYAVQSVMLVCLRQLGEEWMESR